jgi:hypothetical protein
MTELEPERKFNRESVRGILENHFYTGQVARYRRPKFNVDDDLERPENILPPKVDGNSREALELFAGQHEPLISLETWQAVASLRKSKASTPLKSNNSTRVYPLSGVARCWECFEITGQEFSLRGSLGGKGIVYYRCAYLHDQSLKRGQKKKPRIEGINPVVHSVDNDLARRHKHLRADKLEAQADGLLSKLFIPHVWDDWIAAYYLTDDGMAEFERSGYKYRQELQQLGDLFESGHLSKPDLERRTRILQERLNSLKPALRPEAKNVIDGLRPFSDIWQKLLNTEKRLVLTSIFAGLFFNREGRLIRALAYEPFDALLGLSEDGLIADL